MDVDKSAAASNFPFNEEVRIRFTQAAEQYATGYFLSDPAHLSEAVMLCRPRPSDLVLDVATGTGHTALALAGYVRSVVGLDLTDKMLAVAQQLAEERDIENVDWLLGDATCLPFSNNTFNLYTVREAAHHFYDLETSMREALRVLKRGGRACFIDISPPRAAREFLHEIEIRRDPSHVRCLTIEEWEKTLDKVGFEVEFSELRTTDWDFFSWMQTQAIPVDQAEEMASRIEAVTGPAREELAPRRQAGRLYHSYWHAMIRARKVR